MPRVFAGEALRWYLKRARHPLKDYIVGHFWPWFCRRRVWIKYDGSGVIGVTLNDYLQQRIFFAGRYEPALIDWLKQTLGPSDVFWDVGANIGSVTIVAARQCRRVVAFEPDPRSLESLMQNIRVNNLANVEVVNVALGSQSGTATLHQSSSLNTGMTSLLPGRGQAAGIAEVAVTRADDLIRARPDLSPTVMKIDVEGAEHLVLSGAQALLRQGGLRAIVFEDRRDADNKPTNVEVVLRLNEARYHVEPFALSDLDNDDGMYNFLATPTASR